jgi:hypothetical protein
MAAKIKSVTGRIPLLDAGVEIFAYFAKILPLTLDRF